MGGSDLPESSIEGGKDGKKQNDHGEVIEVIHTLAIRDPLSAVYFCDEDSLSCIVAGVGIVAGEENL